MKTIILTMVVILITACSSSPPLPPQIDKNAPRVPISPLYQKG
jgi:hypothetical protein